MARHLCLVLVVAITCAACGSDNEELKPGNDATVEDAGQEVAPPSDGGLSSCLDRPTDPPSQVTTTLPCDLIPPGMTL